VPAAATVVLAAAAAAAVAAWPALRAVMRIAATVSVADVAVSVADTIAAAAVAVAVAANAVAVVVCVFVVGDDGVLLFTFTSLPVATEATGATTEVARRGDHRTVFCARAQIYSIVIIVPLVVAVWFVVLDVSEDSVVVVVVLVRTCVIIMSFVESVATRRLVSHLIIDRFVIHIDVIVVLNHLFEFFFGNTCVLTHLTLDRSQPSRS
jgi:hypothetical protein